MDKKTILVLGNGPSLQKYPFQSYCIPTIGMNVAYRYWEKINWYPTYYACLDDRVTDEHHIAIYNMFQHRKELGIKKFFLKRRIYDFYPDLKRHPDILYSHEITPKSKGFSNYMRKTTGSWAVRWAIKMGYSKILLLGIDCNYVPLYKEHGMVNYKQQLTKEINNNPNYFFDEYQKKGDYMHVPSKGKEARDLHIESFKKIAKEIKNKKGIQVINCNKESKLYTTRILPYNSIEKELETNNMLSKSIVSEALNFRDSEMVQKHTETSLPTAQNYLNSLNLPKVQSYPKVSEEIFLNKAQLATVKKIEQLEQFGELENNIDVVKPKSNKKKIKGDKIIKRRGIYDKIPQKKRGDASKYYKGKIVVLGGMKKSALPIRKKPYIKVAF